MAPDLHTQWNIKQAIWAALKSGQLTKVQKKALKELAADIPDVENGNTLRQMIEKTTTASYE